MPRVSSPAFAPDCSIEVDGGRVAARTGESVAAALLAAGRPVLARSYKYHRPRGPFCLAGTCGNCFVRADGVPSQRACRTPCRDGLVVETQNAFPSAAHDLLRAIDLVAPRGLDHHHLMTWSRLANRAAVAISRQLAGLGRLPDRDARPAAPPEESGFDALVVGAGPAGLGAAEALARGGRRVLVAERDRAPGGRLRCRFGIAGDPPLAWTSQVAAEVERAGGEVALGSMVLGLWRDGGSPLAGILEAGPPPRLRLVRAGRIVLCPGGTAHPPPFANNDLPGIFGGRGLAVALAEEGVLPARRIVVLGSGAEAAALAGRLRDAGAHTDLEAGAVAAARGAARLRAIALAPRGRRRCDALAVVAPPVPATELAREAGVAVAFDPRIAAFAIAAAGDGWTGVDGIFAAGEATGAAGAAEAADAGRRSGAAAGG